MAYQFISGMLRRVYLCIDDLLRTSRIAQWKAVIAYLIATLSPSATTRLRCAANYLMHAPGGLWAESAVSRARADVITVCKHRPVKDKATVVRCAVVKPRRSGREPGVLLVSFETELRKILALRSFAELQANYRICFMPTWQSFFGPELIELDARATAPYYLMPSDFGELRFASLLGRHARVIPFHAASWVSQSLYSDIPVAKDIDLVMLANFSRSKRHWRLFVALAEMDPALRVTLLGVPLGTRTRDALLHEASLFKVTDRLKILENESDEVVRRTLERSILMCAFSHREGSYVGVAESLMANTPVAMFGNAMIGTKSYINKETGFLLDAKEPLAPQLMDALRNATSMMPRVWAKKAISAEKNCAALNNILRSDYLGSGLEWTIDLASFYCVRFEFFFSEPASRLAADCNAEHDILAARFGLVLQGAEPHLC